MRYFLILLLLCWTSRGAELPQSVYDQWANPAVSTINMPAGSFTLKGAGQGVNAAQPLQIKRSNVTVNFTGCTLLVNPADGANSGFYPIQVSSTPVTSTIFPPGTTRYISHLIGAITPGTTQLSMAENEIVDVQPGETVLIWAGVTPSDPVEPASFIPATVASVLCELITFTAPLGKSITSYGSREGLMAVTGEGLHWKIGDWGTYPSSANFSKGYGVDHGMERFVGGMVENVTFNNLTMELNVVTAAASMPNGMWDVSAVAVNAFTVNNGLIRNPHGIGLHLWRTFNVNVNGFSFLGDAIGKIWNVDTFEAVPVSIWGGDIINLNDLVVTGTNMVVFGTEVGPENIVVDGLAYDSVFTSARTYGGSPTVLNLQAARNAPIVRDASLRAVRTGGSEHGYFTFYPLTLEGYMRFPGTALTAPFDWGYLRTIELNGTVGVGGIEYGPKISVTNSLTVVHGSNSQAFIPPEGIYTRARFKIVTPGDIRDVSDSFGNAYWVAGGSSDWVNVAPNYWYQIQSGTTSLANYMNKSLSFSMFNAGSVVDGQVTLELTYLPRN